MTDLRNLHFSFIRSNRLVPLQKIGKIMAEQKQKDRVRGSLVGGAVGDALGYTVEFVSSYQAIVNSYGPQGITRLETYNSTGKGMISDDTQMTLFTACGLLNAKSNGYAPVPSVCWAYLEWLYTQKGMRSKRFKDCWVGDLPEMNARRAPGITCINALDSILQGREPVNSSKGCGGVMRIAPVPLYGLSQDRIKDVWALDRLAADVSELTHQHPLGYIPSYILSHLIYRLATDECPTRTAFLQYMHEAIGGAYNFFPAFEQYLGYQDGLLNEAITLAKQDLPDHEAIAQLGEGWVAEETLAIAVYCAYKYLDDFKKAVVAAVNHGGDSDSTGAVAGNLVGAAVGYSAIPQEYIQDLQLHDVILHVADDLWRGHTTKYVQPNQ